MNNLPIIMAEAAGKSSNIWQLLFIILLVAGIICFVLAVLFFFLFDIPGVYLLKTGKGARKTVKKMEEINAETGRLRKVNEYMVSQVATGTTAETGETMDPALHQPFQATTANVENAPAEGANQTTVLGQSGSTVMANNETTVLNANAEYDGPVDNAYSYKRETDGKFDITFNLMFTHSDEII